MPKRSKRGKKFTWEDLESHQPPSPSQYEDEELMTPFPLLGDLFHQLENPSFSDFSIKCGTYEWAVHRCVICPQSGFFQKLCTSKFKETVENSVTLHDDNPKIVARLLLGLYTGRYPICRLDRPPYYQTCDEFLEAKRRLAILLHHDQEDEQDSCHDLFFHAGLLHLAEKYDVAQLATKAAQRTLSGMQSLSQVAVLIHEDFVHRYLDTVSMVIEVSYSLCLKKYQPLKDAAVFLARAFLKRGKDMDQYEAEFTKLMQDHPTFAWDMVRKDFRKPMAGGVCSMCHYKTSDPRNEVAIRSCSCGMRNLCGKCPGWGKIMCGNCSEVGWWNPVDEWHLKGWGSGSEGDGTQPWDGTPEGRGEW